MRKTIVEAELTNIDNVSTERDAEKIKRFTDIPENRLYRRAMKLTGDKLNSQYGRFRTEDLPVVAEKSIGAPVLIGHRKDSKPVAKIYDAWVDNGFVITPFYFPKERSDANDLAIDIDSRVLSECSISFQFRRATCSICGENMLDWLTCPHVPGKDYPKNPRRGWAGGTAFYWYDDIIKILEGSIVYRGAHPDTGFIKLAEDWRQIIEKKKQARQIIINAENEHRKIIIRSNAGSNWAVVPFQNLPVNSTRSWDAAEARRAVKRWATDYGEIDWDKYKRAFVIYDASNREATGNYKLPIATVINSRLTAIRAGIHAAMAAVNGSRNKPAVPDRVLHTAYNHLSRYYRKMRETPPERK